MIHIVFQHADALLLEETMQLDETLVGEIFEIKDDWSVGPLQNIDEENGWNNRMAWWQNILKGAPNENAENEFDDRKTVKIIIEKLRNEPEVEAWIWMGQNHRDVMGYYWLMRQLNELQGRLMIVYLNNLPFLNEKGQLFYPTMINEVLSKEIIKAKKLARPITLSEFEIDPDEWKKIAEENSVIRILEGGKKITVKEENFYDAEILKNCTGDWQKANRLITNTVNRMKVKTNDALLMGRLKQLIIDGKLDVNGDVHKGWKDFDVRKFERSQGKIELTKTENAE